jgi:hypothetical protein
MEMLAKGMTAEAMERVLGRSLPSGAALKGVPSVSDLLQRAERAVPKMNHVQLWTSEWPPLAALPHAAVLFRTALPCCWAEHFPSVLHSTAPCTAARYPAAMQRGKLVGLQDC